MTTPTQMQVGPDLWVRMVNPEDLKEQDVNAQVMSPRTFERLTENIRHRGALESLPYCYQAGGEGPIEIVSGHHRVRAAVAAGIKPIPILLDTAEVERGEVVAKQLAHNELVGRTDKEVLTALTAFLESPDHKLLSGLPDGAFANSEEVDTMRLFTPRVDFDFRTVTFAFLPHQQTELERLIDMLDGRQDLVVAAPLEQYEELLKVAARYARLKNVKSGGTAITLMVRLALEELEEAEAAELDNALAAEVAEEANAATAP